MDSLTLKQALLHKKWNFQHRIQCVEFTTKKNKSSIKNFFSECDHIHSKLKKSLMGNFIFNAEVWTYSLQRCSQDHLKHLRWCVLHVTKLSILHVCGIPIYNSAIRVNWEILTFLSRAHVIIQASTRKIPYTDTASIYLSKVKNGKIREMWEIYSKLAIKTPE